jgi:hypothetical protein
VQVICRRDSQDRIAAIWQRRVVGFHTAMAEEAEWVPQQEVTHEFDDALLALGYL